MSIPSIDVVVIIASTREGRLGPTVAAWFMGRAAGRGDMSVQPIDLAHADAEAPAALSGRLAAADAFVVVTPEYNHSFPGPLKGFIDDHFTEWQAKPVAFVSYGGISGGLRAVEHLRQVFAELHAVTVRDTVSFPMAWERFDGTGQPGDDPGPGMAAGLMLDRLAWWAHALREARARRPYAA